MPDTFAQAENQVPQSLLENLREQWQRVLRLDEETKRLESRLKCYLRSRRDCQALAKIPEIGLLAGATKALHVALEQYKSDPDANPIGRVAPRLRNV